MVCSVSTSIAQTNLVGRVYENKNILADEMNKALKNADADIDKAKAEALEKAEKKKGGKLTAEELAKLDEEIIEARKIMEAMKKGMSTSVGVEFKSATEMVMRMSMKISDEALKAAGVSWLKRKAMKAALAMAPKSEKAKYVVKGDMIFVDEGKERDTLRISSDGKYLYGKLDAKTKFTLSRVK
jgi:NADH dehydrogenase/NADH:ubiquinone oxidoreductase subunit G